MRLLKLLYAIAWAPLVAHGNPVGEAQPRDLVGKSSAESPGQETDTGPRPGDETTLRHFLYAHLRGDPDRLRALWLHANLRSTDAHDRHCDLCAIDAPDMAQLLAAILGRSIDAGPATPGPPGLEPIAERGVSRSTKTVGQNNAFAVTPPTDRRVAPGARVVLMGLEPHSWSYHTTADESGFYAFERVRPGRYSLRSFPPPRPNPGNPICVAYRRPWPEVEVVLKDGDFLQVDTTVSR